MVFTEQGKNLIRDFLGGTVGGSPSYMALGSVGSPTFLETNTLLRFEVGGTTRTFDSKNTSNKQIELEMVLPSTEPAGVQPVTLRELVISSGSPYTTGSAFSLSTFADINKTEDVELQSIVSYRIN